MQATGWLVMVAMAACTLGACGGGDDGGSGQLPAAADLYGDWQGNADDGIRVFHFAAVDDGTHAELAGMADVYTLANATGVVQAGHYSIEQRPVTGYGTTDALVTAAVLGGGAGSTFGNAILAYDTTTLTISSASTASGELVLARQ